MEISEVRIKLMDDPHERLQAFCSITFDSCFVIRDLKIIQGAKGSFVAMPSRKLTDRCPRCHCKNHLRALHCNQCRAKLYADIAHPINCDCRELIQRKVLEAYEEEVVRAKEPGYLCTYDDYGEDHFATLREPFEEVEFETPRLVRTQDSSHRIEPAASQPGPPHQNMPAAARVNNGPAAARVNAMSRPETRQVSEESDNFGAGID